MGLGRKDEVLEIGAEQAVDVAADVVTGDATAIFAEILVAGGEDGREGAAGVAPFIDDLFEDAGVGVLRDEAGTEHFEAFAGHFFHDGRVVEEPPATEREQVGELAGVDAEFMLVFAAEEANEEAVFGEVEADSLDRAEVRFADAVTGEFEVGVDEVADADHERHGDTAGQADGEDRFAQEADAEAGFGIGEGIGQGDCHVDRVHEIDPAFEEAANFSHGATGAIGVDVEAFGLENVPVLVPFVEDAVEPEDGAEEGVGVGAAFPGGGFVGVERVIGHDGFADAGEAEDFTGMVGQVAGGKEGAGFGEVAGGGEVEGVEDGDDAPGGLGKGGVVEEEGLPDEVGFGGFREVEVLAGGDVGEAEQLGFQIVISNEFVDAP